MRVFKLQRRGNIHHANRKTCDDAYYDAQISEHTFLFVLTDGCSSARFGGVAADIISKEIVLAFQEPSLSDFVDIENEDWIGLTRRQLIRECFNNSNAIKFQRLVKNIVDNAVGRYMNQTGMPFFDFSSTLLLCLVDTRNRKTVYLNIGDGFAGVISKGCLSVLASPQNINGDSRRTYFVTDPYAVNNMEVSYLDKEYTRLILTTDGLSKLYEESEYEKLFASLCIPNDYELYKKLISPFEGDSDYYYHLQDDITLFVCEPVWIGKNKDNAKKTGSLKKKSVEKKFTIREKNATSKNIICPNVLFVRFVTIFIQLYTIRRISRMLMAIRPRKREMKATEKPKDNNL